MDAIEKLCNTLLEKVAILESRLDAMEQKPAAPAPALPPTPADTDGKQEEQDKEAGYILYTHHEIHVGIPTVRYMQELAYAVGKLNREARNNTRVKHWAKVELIAQILRDIRRELNKPDSPFDGDELELLKQALSN